MLLLKILFRNAFHNKLRSGLTILGIAVAILAFGLLRTVVSSFYAGVEAASASRLVTRNAISIIFALPISYAEKIRQVEGVQTVSWGNWFGGIYIDEKNFFPNFCVDPPTYFSLYPEFVLDDKEKKAFLFDRKGAVAGRKLAAKYRWKVGDTITLKGTIYPGAWDFVLRGIYRGRDQTVDETQFLFHWAYLNEAVKKIAPAFADKVGFYMVGVKNADAAADTAVAIDRVFKNSLAETLTETEKAFNLGFIAMSEAIVTAIQMVSFVIILIIMAVVANTMAMTTRERTGDYAILKTLGFGAKDITLLIFGEALVLTLTGCLVGVLLTFPAARIFAAELATYFPIFLVSRTTIYMDIAAALLMAFFAAIIPTRHAIRIRIADGLRRIG
ncbi:MAG: ABC transporter permease [Smithellaceae bacterium]|nr:FtsX-like permease family protein [Syntrophaceae bacterium]MDD4242440.1 ABC transporter permease [Smithellaceae bacterium]NLX52175.1 FtsX-like permease family protein [Deltaproteobacteria bacterium]